MGPAHPTMSSEQTTALICFSSRNPASGSHVQLCLGTEGNGPDDAPYAFTITVAKGVGDAVNETVVYSFMALFVVNVVVTAVGLKATAG